MLHKEGTSIIGFSFLFLAIANLLVLTYASSWALPVLVISLIIWGLFVQFFRNPVRTIPLMDNNIVYAPADGKVVVIEETTESEYFGDRRIQVSIFMSPLNVHVNRNPIGGIVKYFRYHAGEYLVAWHPKASTENERTTTVISNGKTEVLFRQVAGALAKRIIAYVKEGQEVTQGEDMGFIKFGSRVDLYLPLDAKIEVKIGDVAKGNKTIVARLA
jgi:phosphatidylserine decarboxylase